MRRKNRQIKMLIDLPVTHDDDEAFMGDLQETLDEHGWSMVVIDENGDKTEIPVNRVTLGDIQIEPEEE